MIEYWDWLNSYVPWQSGYKKKVDHMNIVYLIIASLLYFINKTRVLPNNLKRNAIILYG